MGDNKWTSSVLARRPEDGALVWAYQFTPHDSWDFDATGTMVLADLVVTASRSRRSCTSTRTASPTRSTAQPDALLRRRSVRQRQLGHENRSGYGAPGVDPSKQTGASKGNVKDLPEPRGRRQPRLPACVFAAHASVLYLDQQPVHGLRRVAGRAHEGNPLHRRQQPYSAGRRWQYGRVHRLGRGHRQEGVGEPGAVPDLERRAGDRGRRRVLRNPGRLVQVGRRAHRQGAVEVQGRLGRRRQPDHLPRPRRQAVRRRLRRHRRRLVSALGRCALG